MKRTADRLFGDALPLVGARRRPQPDVRSRRMSAVMGGNVRVGLEDSLWLGRGQLAKSNAEQVAQGAAASWRSSGLQVATPDEAREMLKLKGGRNVAF